MASTDDRWQAILADLWQQQARWSTLADQLKKVRRSWTGPLVVLGLAGVVLSTLTPHLTSWLASDGAATTGRNTLQLIAITAGPLLVAIAALLNRELLGPKSEQSWIKARTISEGLKAEGYIYAVAAPPYLDQQAAPALLAKKIGELTENAGELGAPPEVKADPARHPLRPLDADDYVKTRVQNQIDFHLKGARRYASKLRVWRGIAIFLGVVSAALGVISGVLGKESLNTWVAVVATLLATVTSVVYAERYEFLAASYAATVQKLENAVRNWRASSVANPDVRGRFVLDCEAILASQNRQWQDELSKGVSDKLRASEPPAKTNP